MISRRFACAYFSIALTSFMIFMAPSTQAANVEVKKKVHVTAGMKNVIPRVKPPKVSLGKNRNIVLIKGRINNAFYLDAREKGMPKNVALEFIKLYEGTVDFRKDIERGDEFEVLFEVKRNSSGKVIGAGSLIYTKLSTQSKTKAFYLYIKSNKDKKFVDDSGHSPYRNLLTRPLKYSRLSSKFGKRRLHITGENRRHKGIDLSAPPGSAIYAAGSGKLTHVGRAGAYGNYIKIKHSSQYQTAYGHLKSFAPGLSIGSFVKRGQVIGYVGSTGRSTGNHLHYEILLRGKHIDPDRLINVSWGRLSGEELARFKQIKVNIDGVIRGLKDGQSS